MELRFKLVSSSFCIIAILTFVVGVAGQGGSQPKPQLPSSSIDPGSTEGTVYTNRALGLRIKYPARMVADSREDLDKVSQEGLELYKKWDGKDQKIAEKLADRERSVFSISAPVGAGEPIASLTLSVAKDLTGGDLEKMVSSTVKMFISAPNLKLSKPIVRTELSGITCYTFELSIEISGKIVRSTTFSMKRNGYLLSFSITHLEDRGFDLMEKILKDLELFELAKCD